MAKRFLDRKILVHCSHSLGRLKEKEMNRRKISWLLFVLVTVSVSLAACSTGQGVKVTPSLTEIETLVLPANTVVPTNTPTPAKAPTSTTIPTPTRTSAPTKTSMPTKMPVLMETPTFIIPPGLSVEEYPLSSAPQVEPLTFTPVQGTQEEILARHQQEQSKSFPNNSVIVNGQPGFSIQMGSEKLVALESFSSTITSLGAFSKVSVQVLRNGESIYSISAGYGSPMGSLQGLWTYSDHWVLEIVLVTQVISSSSGGISFDAVGQIVRDGELLNEREGYKEAFGFQLMDGKPFYFFKRNGQIGISYDDQQVVLGYTHVVHYACCSGAELNPRRAKNMVAFFALRDERWHYVEIGVFKQ